MKVFLSFSGDASREIALALCKWLPKVIQAVQPFISEDIGKGARWSEELAKELNETDFGIICITPDNTEVPWINFEAGALSKAIPDAVHQPWVMPLLFKTGKEKISEPLKQFQEAAADREGVLKMLASLNGRLGEGHLTNELLEQEFEKWWPELKGDLDKVKVGVHPIPQYLDWLYTAERLAEIQGKIKCREIWVITPELYRRTVHPKVETLIRKNIKRGVRYTFVTITSKDTAEARRDFESMFKVNSKSYDVVECTKGMFTRLAVTDYIVLNPNPDPKHGLHVYLELPTEERGYWIEVDSAAAYGFVRRFRSMVEGKRD